MKDFYNSYERDVLNGNAYSKSYWKTNAVGTIGIAFLGSKGVGSLTKVGEFPGKTNKAKGKATVYSVEDFLDEMNSCHMRNYQK